VANIPHDGAVMDLEVSFRTGRKAKK